MEVEENINFIKNKISAINNFPKDGIVFRDIFSVLKEPAAFEALINILKKKISAQSQKPDVVIGLDSRGFIFGSILAYEMKMPFIPIRKKGKLPGDVVQKSFKLEYGEDAFEIQKSSIVPGMKVVIIDDLLATGGTMKAALELVRSLGAEVILCLVCIELADLNGRSKLDSVKVETVVTF